MRIHSPKMTNAEATGSFSGSFTGVGNFEGLTADSVEYANVTNKPTLISGSEQVTLSGTIGYSAFSSSIDTSISTEKGRIDAILNASETDADSFKEIVDLINSVDTTNDQAFAGYVTSSGNRLTALESSVAGLDSTYATDVALSNASGALDTNIKANASAIANLDGNYATDSQLSNVSGALDTSIKSVATDLANLDSTYASDSQLSNVSGALDTSIKANTSLIAALDTTYASDSQLSSVSGALDTSIKANASAIAGLDSTYATDTSVSSAVSSLSSSVDVTTDALAADIATNSSAIAGLDSTYATDTALGLVDTKANTNASNISSNDSDIATNASGIATNAADIATNTGKLAGIEVGATADQTPAQLLTAIKTVDGAGSGLDADLLDGNTSSHFATAASVSTHAAKTDNPHSVTKSQVGLGNVTNESKSTLLNNTALTGTPTAPTAIGSDDSTKIATTAFVQDRVDAVIGTAGAALDTLGELSASLASDQSGLASLTTTVGTKLAKASNLSDLTNASTARGNLGLGTAATQNSGVFASSVQGSTADSAVQPDDLATVATSGAYSDLSGKPTTISGPQATAIATNSNKVSNVSTDLSTSASSTALVVNSSDGNNASIPAATPTTWGAMTDEDKAKLDGIESGAKGDQTASEILTAIKTVDGAGSGLDADLLDGNSSAYFGTATAVSTNAADIATNTGKLAGIEAGATGDQSAAEILTAIKTVDGAGSGLDADLLDGNSSAHYATAASVSTNTSNIATNTGKLAGIEAGATADQSAAEILTAIKTVDGAGSGLDADKLDGNSSAHYATAASVSTNTSNIATNTGKLAGIEAGATADQSAAEILTAIKTVDGAGSGLDADKLDGNSSAHYATAASVSTNTSNISANASAIGTINAKDPVLTVTGDVSGTATFTNLGNATLSATVADDSHNHIIGNVDGLQAALNAKANLASPALTGNPTVPTQTGTNSSTRIASTAFVQGRIDDIIGTAGATLDTLGELSASLASDQSGLAALTTTVGTKLAKASNLSDLASPATSRANLGVDTKSATYTGVSGDISINSSGVAVVADDSHNHIIGNVDGLQAALNAKQASGTYNTVIGTDTDVDTSGATVIDNIYMTDGVITSHGTRTLTLANLGYTGATNANYITNNNQLANGAGYITSYVNNIDMGSGFKVANSAGTDQFTITENEDLRFAGAGATSVSFDPATQKVTISSTDNNTVYSHPSHPGDDFSVDTGALTGATVVSDIDINVTTDSQGHVTDANGTVATRTLTLANLGYTGATNANYITNNNQLANGAGYITSYVNNIDMGSGFKVANSAGTDQFTITENEDLRFAGAGATSVSFDPATQKVTISSTDNNTVYSHPSHPGDDFSVDTGALTGATVVSDIDINVTTDSQGHVTDANGTVATRTLTLANLGYTGATNANYITNNNQLTNGAGYQTSAGSVNYATSAGNAGTVDGKNASDFFNDGDTHLYMANGDGIVWNDTTNVMSVRKDGTDYELYSTDNLSLSTLGYTGATNANYITNNNQLTNGAGYQNANQVASAVAAVVDSAPGTLNTLNELAAALGDDANFATTMTNALANKQAAGTYNTVIGTDSDINTSGATIIDNIYMTDGVLTSHGTRVLTLGDLGYTGATNANYITNNNQLTNGAGYVAGTKSSAESTSTVVERTSSGYIHASYYNGSGTFSTSGAGSGMGLFTGTNGTDTYGRSYTAAAARALLNVANGATNVTNNNQLTNGAGYITGYTNTTYSAGRGLDLSGTTFNLETDLRDSISYIGYDANDYIYWSNNGFQQFVVGGTERLRVDTAGIDVSGRIVADSDITAYSDERLKKDIKTIEGALDKTKALRGVEFTRIADDSRSIGVVAQELEAILPELVLTDDEGMKSVNYAQITGLLIEAVKELSAKVDKLENK